MRLSLFFLLVMVRLGAALTGTLELKSPTSEFYPGVKVDIEAKIVNQGKEPSEPGEIWIEFSLPKQFQGRLDHSLFQSEKIELPALEPGKGVNVVFKTKHTLPTLYDYVKQDWAMRRYQLVYNAAKGQKEILAQLPLLFTASYYPGREESVK